MSGDEAKGCILVVEDEEPIRDGICDLLHYHGFSSAAVASGEAGLKRADVGDIDLVILDVMLPQLSGLDVCSALRETQPRLPILMLTAKGSEDDVVSGLRSGADDYLTKPFSVRELMARVEALLRRSASASPRPNDFSFGPWQVQGNELMASSGERRVRLTCREVALLALLHQNRGRVVSRRTLLIEVWRLNNVDEIETRTVDVHIAKLRRKICHGGNRLIETVRGAGYRATI